MSRTLAVLRPEPGNRVVAAAIEAEGRTALRLPLFATRPLAWVVPDPTRFDALILTSANALRQGGAGLAALRQLPVHAVGEATASAARRAGFAIAATGDAGAAQLVERAAQGGVRRALHLTGHDHTLAAGGIVAAVVPVYASEALPMTPEQSAALDGTVALVQSARAAARLAEIVRNRASIALAALSPAVAAAAGEGWQRIAVADRPTTEALIDTALALAD